MLFSLLFFFFSLTNLKVIDEMLHHLRTAEELCLPSAADGQGRTPLHAAAQSNRHKHSVDTVRALIEAGADIEAEDNMVIILSFCFCFTDIFSFFLVVFRVSSL